MFPAKEELKVKHQQKLYDCDLITRDVMSRGNEFI